MNKKVIDSFIKILDNDLDNRDEILNFMKRMPDYIYDSLDNGNSCVEYVKDGSLYSCKVFDDSIIFKQQFPRVNLDNSPIYLNYELLLNEDDNNLGYFKNQYIINCNFLHPEQVKRDLFPYINFENCFSNSFGISKDVKYSYFVNGNTFKKIDTFIGTEDLIYGRSLKRH